MDQITRSPRLEGHLGDDGLIRFGAPGQRVTSTIKLKTLIQRIRRRRLECRSEPLDPSFQPQFISAGETAFGPATEDDHPVMTDR